MEDEKYFYTITDQCTCDRCGEIIIGISYKDTGFDLICSNCIIELPIEEEENYFNRNRTNTKITWISKHL